MPRRTSRPILAVHTGIRRHSIRRALNGGTGLRRNQEAVRTAPGGLRQRGRVTRAHRVRLGPRQWQQDEAAQHQERHQDLSPTPPVDVLMPHLLSSCVVVVRGIVGTHRGLRPRTHATPPSSARPHAATRPPHVFTPSSMVRHHRVEGRLQRDWFSGCP